MNHISMIPNAPGLWWGQEIELCSNLQNVSFSRERKVYVKKLFRSNHVDNVYCTINLHLLSDEHHLYGKYL